MTRDSSLMSGIILITVTTIQYGRYFLLTSLMSKRSGYMENPPRQNFFRAGHAHARRQRDSFAGLSNPSGLGGATLSACLVCAHWSAFVGDSHIGRILLLAAAAGGYQAQRSGKIHLRGRSHSCDLSNHAGYRVGQDSAVNAGFLFECCHDGEWAHIGEECH